MEISGQPHTPAALLLGKEPPLPIDRRLGGPQSRSGRGGKEKQNSFLLLSGIELGRPVRNLVNTQAELGSFSGSKAAGA
jgi:hypothetical protein